MRRLTLLGLAALAAAFASTALAATPDRHDMSTMSGAAASQKLGVAIVVAGFVISSVFWYYRMPLWTYGVLFATALIDVVLYFTVGNVLHCYRCQAQYRGVPGLENHGGFDLETHEKHRQQKIRLAEAAAAQAAAKES